MNFGCHAVLFRDRIKSETDEVLAGLASSGFTGVEIGSRFFGTADRQRLVDSLERNGLSLAGMHVGARLDEWLTDFDGARTRVLEVAQFVRDLPFRNVIMSGGNPEGEIDAPLVAERINQVAEECLALGAQLNYHNHWWEFKRGFFEDFYAHAPALHFAVDLGWVYAGGTDPVAFLEAHPERIGYLHLRDVGADRKTFPDLGGGVVDLDRLLRIIAQRIGADGWVIVEYEEGDQDFDRYKRAHEFLSPYMH